jgi:hypothetical protein
MAPLLYKRKGKVMETEKLGKIHLTDSIDKQIKLLQKQLLDISELVVPQTSWKAFRSKVLGISNDIRRDIITDVELNYKVIYEPNTVYEDVIEVVTRRPINKGKEEK